MTTLGARDILNYDSKNKVLICQQCKYAIQKSALGSHLLRHKIYRGERQRLLSSIARLDILEPDNVQLPPPGSSPVDGLPIISGYRCTATGCGNLCASSKRMRRHWSDVHGLSDPPSSFARPAELQTFFRGTKLRYFEVASRGGTARAPIIPPLSGGARQVEETQEQHDHLHSASTPAPAPPSLISAPPSCLDLETLRYFHHFTTTTSLTLPVSDHGSAQCWQTNVVGHALKLNWLMCGLLAISASHLAALSDDGETQQMHLGRSARFLQESAAGWEDFKRNFGGPGRNRLDSDEGKAAAQLLCIQRCYHWTSEPSVRLAFDEEMISQHTPFNLKSFTRTVQGCFDPSFALRCAVSSDDLPDDILPDQGPSNSSETTIPSTAPPVPPALMDRLRTLPYRMREALGKPDSPLDFFATLSAIDALVECFPISYKADDVEAVWTGMVSWLRRVSDHYTRMVWRRDPGALVVLAHWSLLVERAERHCWFLRKCAARLRCEIVDELPNDGKIRKLVDWRFN